MVKSKTSQLQKKLTEAQSALKRTLADYANLEKRVTAEREVLEKLVLVNIITQFLPVFDNLVKAAVHTKDNGIVMIVNQFKQILAQVGVKEIGSVGEKFDSKFHEAVETVQGSNDGKVVEVINPGFIIDGQVIRPAKVKVEKTKIDKKAEEKAEKAADFGDYA